jgi:hypothetical protein
MNAAPPYPPYSTAPRSGLSYLRNNVAAYLAGRDVPVIVAPVGLKYRFSTLVQGPSGAGRIVFIPGIFDGAPQLKPRKYGTIDRDTDNATSVCNPREIGMWSKAFTISIWAPPDSAHPQDEQRSHALADDLLEWLFRAVNNIPGPDGKSVSASILWGDVILQSPPTEQAFGVELLVNAIQREPIFDETLEVVQATPFIQRG